MTPPLVSGIMPTRERPEWAARAVSSFLGQTYLRKQLVIMDDGDAPSFPEGEATFTASTCAVKYKRLATRFTIAEKRNFACAMASGDLIMHFDSDDWSHPDRMTDQVQRLEGAHKAVTGYHTMIFYNPETQRAGRYRGHSRYIIGTSLCFQKTWWAAHPFEDKPHQCEDNAFIDNARDAGEVIAADADRRLIALVHSGNSVNKHMDLFEPVPLGDLPSRFLREFCA